MTRRDFLQNSLVAAGGALILGRGRLGAADAPAAPVGTFNELRRGAGFFTARGGTIGWFINRDVALIIDTQFPDTVGTCLDGMKTRAGREIDLVINTHHHGDHTGGNVALPPRGIRRIVAHENVPRLMRDQPGRQRSTAPIVTPNETFSERWRLEVGDEVVSARYFGPAHTGGDIMIHLERANVVHTGDLMFNRLHPVIDRPSGGSIAGWIKVLETAADHYPADTTYIFGHGRDAVTGAKADLFSFRDYLTRLLETVRADMRAGRTIEQIRQQRTALEGFEDYGSANRLGGDLQTAFDELSAAGGTPQ